MKLRLPRFSLYYKQISKWETCPGCNVTCYCSEACRIKHAKDGHERSICHFLAMNDENAFARDGSSFGNSTT